MVLYNKIAPALDENKGHCRGKADRTLRLQKVFKSSNQASCRLMDRIPGDHLPSLAKALAEPRHYQFRELVGDLQPEKLTDLVDPFMLDSVLIQELFFLSGQLRGFHTRILRRLKAGVNLLAGRLYIAVHGENRDIKTPEVVRQDAYHLFSTFHLTSRKETFVNLTQVDVLDHLQ